MGGVGITCAWCKAEMWQTNIDSADISHGICIDCTIREFAVPVESLPDLGKEALDRLPFGVILLDFQGRIVEFSRVEAEMSHRSRESVLGKNFFAEVAPCTAVKEFQGQFDELVRARQGVKRFSFVYSFPGRRAYVSVQLRLSAGSKTVAVMVKTISEQKTASSE